MDDQTHRTRSGQERRHRHGAEDHNAVLVVKPDVERLEEFVREQVQRFIQALLEEEVSALLGVQNQLVGPCGWPKWVA